MSPEGPQIAVVHNRPQQRFEVRMEGEVAFLSYRVGGGQIILDHTYVPPRFRGKGVAAALAGAALNEACEQRWRVVPQCSYVALFIERNPKFATLVAGQSG